MILYILAALVMAIVFRSIGHKPRRIPSANSIHILAARAKGKQPRQTTGEVIRPTTRAEAPSKVPYSSYDFAHRRTSA